MNIYLDIDGTIKQAELDVLEANDADTGFFKIEPWDPACLKDALEYIQNYNQDEKIGMYCL